MVSPGSSLQALIFPKGLTFDGEALGTPETAFIFRVLDPGEAGVEELVDQLRTSWNPLVSWLRDVQAWGLAAGRLLLGEKW